MALFFKLGENPSNSQSHHLTESPLKSRSTAAALGNKSLAEKRDDKAMAAITVPGLVNVYIAIWKISMLLMGKSTN